MVGAFALTALIWALLIDCIQRYVGSPMLAIPQPLTTFGKLFTIPTRLPQPMRPALRQRI